MARSTVLAIGLLSCGVGMLALTGVPTGSSRSEIPKLQSELRERDPMRAVEAFRGLARQGDAAADTLIAATSDERAWVRVHAWRALGRIPAVVPRLRPLLVERVRAAFPAAEGLPWESSRALFESGMITGLGSLSERGIVTRQRADTTPAEFEARDAEMEKYALLAVLAEMGARDSVAFRGEIAPEMATPAADGLSMLRHAEAWAVTGRERSCAEVPFDFSSQDTAVVREALLVASGCSKWIAQHTPDILALLASEDATRRAEALAALIAVDADLSGQRAELENRIADPDGFVRLQVARALLHCVGDAQRGHQLLETMRGDPDAVVRRGVVHELGLLALEPDGYHRNTARLDLRERQMGFVFSAFADRDARVRLAAVGALARFGADSRKGLKALEALVEDSDAQVQAAARALSGTLRN